MWSREVGLNSNPIVREEEFCYSFPNFIIDPSLSFLGKPKTLKVNWNCKPCELCLWTSWIAVLSSDDGTFSVWAFFLNRHLRPFWLDLLWTIQLSLKIFQPDCCFQCSSLTTLTPSQQTFRQLIVGSGPFKKLFKKPHHISICFYNVRVDIQ